MFRNWLSGRADNEGVMNVSRYEGEATVWASPDVAEGLVSLITSYADAKGEVVHFDSFQVHNQRVPCRGVRVSAEVLDGALATAPDWREAIESAPPIPPQGRAR